MEHRDFYGLVEQIYTSDKRYKPDAYEFVMQALHFTQSKLRRRGHVHGGELLDGIRRLIIDKYGPMAKTVLEHWGIRETQDFGNIVFNMVDRRILAKTENDSPAAFKNVYDFEEAFGHVLRDSPLPQE
ncbi:MAG: hypothetical protein MJA29_01800 [Candidatus Omnitrophica bacterium]|nr:hypothetical protein [Candidatus Omnitrophota bacterium]